MTEPLEMNLQERMLILSLASKTCEMLEDPLPPENRTNLLQWKGLANQVRPLLKRLDQDNPTLIPLPHDGVTWAER